MIMTGGSLETEFLLDPFEPAYLALHRSGELQTRAEAAASAPADDEVVDAEIVEDEEAS